MNIHAIVKREREVEMEGGKIVKNMTHVILLLQTHTIQILLRAHFMLHMVRVFPQLALHSLSSPGLLFPPSLSHSQSVE